MKKTILAILMALCVFVGTVGLLVPAFAERPDGDPLKYLPDGELLPGGKVTLALGATKDLRGSIALSGYSGKDLEDWYLLEPIAWKSSNPEVISFSGGVATANRLGTAKITATAWDNTGTKRVQALTATVGTGELVQVKQNHITVPDGTRVDVSQLFKTVGYQSVSWISNNTSVATVDKDGLVSTMGVGNCAITATITTAGGEVLTEITRIRVVTSATNPRMCSVLLRLGEGQSVAMDKLLFPDYYGQHSGLSDISCASNDSSIVSVSNMRLTAKAPGGCTAGIYRTTDDGREYLYTLTITVEG